MDKKEELTALTNHFENMVSLAERRALFMEKNNLGTHWVEEKLIDLAQARNMLLERFKQAEEHPFPSLPVIRDQFDAANFRLRALTALFKKRSP